MLNKKGKLIIYQNWDNKLSLSANIISLKNYFKEYEIEIKNCPNGKLYKLIKVRILSLIIDRILRFFLKKNKNKLLIISNK